MVDVHLRCAVIARAEGYLPAGTAASAPVFVLVEVPLPWPSDVAEHPMLRELVPVLAPHRARLQALVPDLATPDGQTRVIVYRHPDPEGPFRRYHRTEHVTTPGDLADTVAAALDDPPTDHRVDTTARGTEVLVCTHGSRDVCCGGEGMRSYAQLVVLQLPGVHVWRTSHTGGHRFAPTAVTFPDGRAWASIDADVVEGILARTLDPKVAAAHDRGCAAFADPFAQAAETAVFAEEGWGWLDLARTVDSTLVAEDRRVVTVTGHDPKGEADPVAYSADVVVRRVVPVPDCGHPLEEARKTSLELEVLAVDRL
jgi:hypothetical protein